MCVCVTTLLYYRTCRGTEDGRRCGHIPYRNSMLTMVLRDSLGTYIHVHVHVHVRVHNIHVHVQCIYTPVHVNVHKYHLSQLIFSK